MPSGGLMINVVHFVRLLRRAGLRVGVADAMDAVRSVAEVGVESRGYWHAALKATLVKREQDSPLFDEAFALFWRDPALMERMMQQLLPRVQGRVSPSESMHKRLSEAMLPQVKPRNRLENQEVETEIDTTLTFSAVEKLQRMDFEQMSLAECAQVEGLLKRELLHLPRRKVRRLHSAEVGPRWDKRGTGQAALRCGGELIELRRATWQEPIPPLVILCDISGSMQRYTRMLLVFICILMEQQRRAGGGVVEVFLMGTRLSHVSRAMQVRDIDHALATLGDTVPDWAGGTRLGTCLDKFNRDWARRVLGQHAKILLVTDGLERDEQPILEEAMQRLARSGSRLWWLNPLLRYAQFEPKALGHKAILPYVSAHLPVHNFLSLRDLVGALGQKNLRSP